MNIVIESSRMDSILKLIVIAHVSVAARWASRRVSHVQDVVASTGGVPISNRYFVAVFVCAISNVAILEWDRRAGDAIYVPNPTTIVDWGRGQSNNALCKSSFNKGRKEALLARRRIKRLCQRQRSSLSQEYHDKVSHYPKKTSKSSRELSHTW